MNEETPRPIMLYVENGMFMGKEMVFCKDCKYYGYEGMRYCTRVMDEYRIGFLMDADDFCSRGVKR